MKYIKIIILLCGLLLFFSTASADHLPPIRVWLHWDYEEALPLDMSAIVSWEEHCTRLGGTPRWRRIAMVTTTGVKTHFDSMACMVVHDEVEKEKAKLNVFNKYKPISL